MALYRKLNKGFLAIGILLLGAGTLINAQTTAKILDSSENEVVFKVENLQSDQTPTKILLVFDSNLITLESTSTKTKKYNTYFLTSPKKERYSSANNMEWLLAVDMEKEMEVEEWMTHSFNTKSSLESFLEVEQEEEIPLEDWMTDLESW